MVEDGEALAEDTATEVGNAEAGEKVSEASTEDGPSEASEKDAAE